MDLQKSPWLHFEDMFEKAQKVEVEASAMSLATSTLQGRPSVRVVLYKGRVQDGLMFVTNYESHKGQQLQENPWASSVFYWPNSFQQIRFEGQVFKLSRSESQSYFATRPRLSQIGAWASSQSQVLKSYEDLRQSVMFFEKKFEGQEVPCPDSWGAYTLVPERIEFWLGRQGRLHERYVYESSKKDFSEWKTCMLHP